MISHDRAQELISARMDAPLTAAEHRELQNHLASCVDCRLFVSQADAVARDLQVMPRLAPSPAVSRAVLAAISDSNSGWDWLRGGLRLLSSPGMAVATSMALIVALASALIVALNAPGTNNPGSGAEPQETIAAAAVAQIPTEVPPTATQAPKPTEMAAVAPTVEATRPTGRTIEPAATRAAKSPTPRPTATSVPIQAVSAPDQTRQDAPIIEPSNGEAPVDQAPPDDQVLAMAPEDANTAGDAGSVDVAQEAAPEVDEAQPVENTDTGEAVDAAPSENADAAAEPDNTGEKNNGKKSNGDKTASEPAPAEPEPTRPIGPLPAEAIAALEGAGGVPNISLPPAAPGPMDPMMPDQSFLPVTPTPVSDGTPTPEGDAATESQSPQLAEGGSSDLPIVAEAPSESNKDSKKVKEKEKRDKSSQAGDSYEQKQVAWEEAPMASWSSEPVVIQPMVALQQETPDQSTAGMQTADSPTGDAAITGDAADPTLTGESADGTAVAPERQIDPATGMEIDPATGFLIDPTTGYLIDRANGRVIDPRTGYQVHPMTGLLIDPATGALLDPNTLAVVVPPGFGSDQPAYVPGSDGMHDQIEGVVDATYDNATIQIVPPTDGPVQPVGEIVVPTESGDALEIS